MSMLPHNSHGGLSQAGFIELWNPLLFVILAAIAILYLYMIKKSADRIKGVEQIPLYKKGMFLFGLFLFYVSEGSPLYYIGHHYLFSVHMANQALTYIAVPPLILGGLPAWLIRPVFRRTLIKKTVRMLTNPFLAVVLFNALFSFYHLPTIFDWLMSHPFYMTLSSGFLFISALIMWWPLVTPLSEYNRLSYLQKLGYVFAAGVLLTPACALIIFSNTVLYETYINAHRLIEWFTPLDDQQAGGIIMKVLQEIIYGTMLGVIFFQWARKEKHDSSSDQLLLEK